MNDPAVSPLPYDDWVPPWKREYLARVASKDRCVKCLQTPPMNHPFHDNGNPNPDCDLSEFAMPDWHKDADGKVTG